MKIKDCGPGQEQKRFKQVLRDLSLITISSVPQKVKFPLEFPTASGDSSSPFTLTYNYLIYGLLVYLGELPRLSCPFVCCPYSPLSAVLIAPKHFSCLSEFFLPIIRRNSSNDERRHSTGTAIHKGSSGHGFIPGQPRKNWHSPKAANLIIKWSCQLCITPFPHLIFKLHSSKLVLKLFLKCSS